MHANYNPTMTTISQTTQSLGRNWLLKRMTEYGYSNSLCEKALEQFDYDESKALALLQWCLVHGEEPMPQKEEGHDAEELKDMRKEELEALGSIYGNRLQHRTEKDKDEEHISVQLEAPWKKLTLDVIIPEGSNYPYTVPLMTIQCEDMPSYLKLSVIKGLVLEAEATVGMPLIYTCVEWLQEHIDGIVANPPKLREITEGMSMAMLAAPRVDNSKKRKPKRSRLSAAENEAISKRLKEDLEKMHASDQYNTSIRGVREKLPADGFKAKVLEAVYGNQTSIVSGETGCGKTTQVPQFILDEEISNGRGATCNIICTQPRKVAAIGVADRVATERCEKVGQTVGYAVRGDTKASKDTRLQFVTTGVLLRRLQSDPQLEGVSHVLVDEVHERSGKRLG